SQSLRQFLADAAYTRNGMRQTLGSNELNSPKLHNLPQLLYRTLDCTAHNILLRWFAVGVPVELRSAHSVIPDEIRDILTQCGLLVRQGDQLVSTAMLNPFEGMIIAADHSATIEEGLTANVVLGLNATTWLLYRFTSRNPVRETLDFGCGSGAQTLAATR